MTYSTNVAYSLQPEKNNSFHCLKLLSTNHSLKKTKKTAADVTTVYMHTNYIIHAYLVVDYSRLSWTATLNWDIPNTMKPVIITYM